MFDKKEGIKAKDSISFKTSVLISSKIKRIVRGIVYETSKGKECFHPFLLCLHKWSIIFFFLFSFLFGKHTLKQFFFLDIYVNSKSFLTKEWSFLFQWLIWSHFNNIYTLQRSKYLKLVYSFLISFLHYQTIMNTTILLLIP